MNGRLEAEQMAAKHEATRPVAWAALFCGSPLVVSRFKQICDDEAHYQGDVATVIPLYRSPTLTDAEREAVQAAAVMLDARNRLGGPVMFRGSERANTLYGLLARCAIGHQDGHVTEPLPVRKTT